MSWYVHPSRQLRDDELPPELVVTNRDGSIEQVYVPYDATGEQLKAENARLRELVRESLMDYRQYAEKYGLPPYLSDVNEHLDARLRELGIEVSQ